MASDSGSLVFALFAALGTIVGYLGGEVACASVFNRILWPERYYNSASRPYAIPWIVALMPMGGPIHKSAVEAMDQLVELGLWKGLLRGYMLGSVFYKNTDHRYVVHVDRSSTHELKSARNALWITVMQLVAGRSGHQLSSSCPSGRLEAGRSREQDIRQRLPFLILKLRRDQSEKVPSSPVTGDIGPLRLRYFGGIVVSEAISIIFGVATALKWKTPFAIWYFAPLLLKLIALFCRVRRQPGKGPGQFDPPGDGDRTIFEVDDKSKGFFIIVGPRQVVYQFFHHYGHPLRSTPASRLKESDGFNFSILGEQAGNRSRELISMFCVLAFIFVYPVGLIVFAFTTTDVQWVWLGYELMMMISMHAYRYLGGENRGTTQEWLAKELAKEKLPVCFDDGSDHGLIVELEREEVNSVKEGREKLSMFIDGYFPRMGEQ